MSVSTVTSPFICLLNSISDNLSPQNLQSLIHICVKYIPESRREEIRNGLDVFRILKQQDVIDDDLEKAQNLEQIMKKMRPKRKDVIKRVRDFIRTNYDPQHDFQSSGESYVHCEPPAVLAENHHPPPRLDRYNSSGLHSLSGQTQRDPSDEARPTNTQNHCAMDCCCLGCKCYARRIPSCVLLTLTGIMAIVTFLSSLLWFDKLPKTLYSKLGTDGSKAGGYIVGCCGAATIAFLIWWIYRKVRGNRHVGQIPYQSFKNYDPMDAHSTVVEKGPSIPLASVKRPIKKQKRRPFGSTTAGSSLDTAASASVLEREHRRPHGNSTTEDGELQTDGACASGEADDFQSRKSLVTAVETD